nr:hypothetical protein [Tanacetum cinerariifolium]
MEVTPTPLSPAADINSDSTSTSPYATAPSSPQSTIPFTWEHKPGISKHHYFQENDQETEANIDFDFGYLERHSISAADELFDCGKIKPLKPPPRLHVTNDSPKSPKSPKLRFKLDNLSLSPRSSTNKKHEFDPFSEAMKQTSNDCMDGDHAETKRGRKSKHNERKVTKVSRSLSPYRVGHDVLNDEKNVLDHHASSTWYNKWNLKNLLLFRSASEGSASTRKDALKKYMMLKKNETFSFRSTTEEFDEGKKNVSLSYKSPGLMGCLRLHQHGGSVHEITRGINSVIKR